MTSEQYTFWMIFGVVLINNVVVFTVGAILGYKFSRSQEAHDVSDIKKAMECKADLDACSDPRNRPPVVKHWDVGGAHETDVPVPDAPHTVADRSGHEHRTSPLRTPSPYP